MKMNLKYTKTTNGMLRIETSCDYWYRCLLICWSSGKRKFQIKITEMKSDIFCLRFGADDGFLSKR